MTNDLPPHHWIDFQDGPMVTWAKKYLIKNELLALSNGNSNESDDELIKRSMQEMLPLKYKELFKMKGAWSQKKSRDKRNGKKSYTFVMSKKVETQLNQLSKQLKKPKNAALEDIISVVHQYLVGKEEETKAQQTIAQERLSNLIALINRNKGAGENLASKIVEAPPEVKEQQN